MHEDELELTPEEIASVVRLTYAGTPPMLGEETHGWKSDSLIDRFLAYGYVNDLNVVSIFQTARIREWNLAYLDWLWDKVPEARFEDLENGATPTDEESLLFKQEAARRRGGRTR